MAKLDVKVLYNDEVYEKFDGKVQEAHGGDLVTFEKDGYSYSGHPKGITAGAFYELEDDLYFSGDDVGMEIGLTSGFAKRAGKATIFRKVEAKQPQKPKKPIPGSKDVNPGDKIRINRTIADHFDEGDVLTVKSAGERPDGYPMGYSDTVYTEEFPDIFIISEEYEVIDGDEDLTPGTKVKVHHNGSIKTIRQRRPETDGWGALEGKAYTFTTGTWLLDTEFDVIDEPKSTEKHFQAGDIVEITGDSLGHPVGTIGVAISYNRVEANGKIKRHSATTTAKLLVKKADRKDLA